MKDQLVKRRLKINLFFSKNFERIKSDLFDGTRLSYLHFLSALNTIALSLVDCHVESTN